MAVTSPPRAVHGVDVAVTMTGGPGRAQAAARRAARQCESRGARLVSKCLATLTHLRRHRSIDEQRAVAEGTAELPSTKITHSSSLR